MSELQETKKIKMEKGDELLVPFLSAFWCARRRIGFAVFEDKPVDNDVEMRPVVSVDIERSTDPYILIDDVIGEIFGYFDHQNSAYCGQWEILASVCKQWYAKAKQVFKYSKHTGILSTIVLDQINSKTCLFTLLKLKELVSCPDTTSKDVRDFFTQKIIWCKSEIITAFFDNIHDKHLLSFFDMEHRDSFFSFDESDPGNNSIFFILISQRNMSWCPYLDSSKKENCVLGR